MGKDSDCGFRVGTGWDIHPLVENRPLILGGVTVPSGLGCSGHSDGDALVHAIIDALLGACGLEDIGTFFPDTDPAYNGINSMVLLSRTLEIVRKEGFIPVNVDSTVILQSPKLMPYKSLMKKTLAQAMELDESCVCVKAKTAERMLGELGTGKAVECQASVLLRRVRT